MAQTKSKERSEEPLGTMSYQTSSKRSPPFWLLIGARKLVFFWYQSEARTAATVWNWSGKTLSPGAFLAVLYFSSCLIFPPVQTFPRPHSVCPWVSEDGKICCKVSQQVAVLNRLKKILPFELRIDIYIYLTFIAPHFNYCSESWRHCGKRGSGKLEKINERALRFVTRCKSTTYETLLKQLNLLSPLNQRMDTGVYKAIHGYKVPRGIGELLHERSTNYNLRGKHILELPKVNTTTYGLKLWSYTAAKI